MTIPSGPQIRILEVTTRPTKDGVTDDIHLFNEKLREWEDYYNYHRPHGALDGHTPYERVMAKARAGLSPAS